METIIALLALFVVQHFIPQEQKLFVILSGIAGVVIYLLIDGITHWLEQKEEESINIIATTVKGSGLVGFCILSSLMLHSL